MALSKKSLILPIALAVVVTAAAVGVGTVRAEEEGKPRDNLVEKLAEKFKLNKTDVQKVFDENRASHEGEHQERLGKRLQQAVDDKKITTEQKEQILTKLEELKTFRESLRDKTPKERREAMKAKLNELKQWTENNDIPKDLIGPAKAMHGRHGFGGGPKDDH